MKLMISKRDMPMVNKNKKPTTRLKQDLEIFLFKGPPCNKELSRLSKLFMAG